MQGKLPLSSPKWREFATSKSEALLQTAMISRQDPFVRSRDSSELGGSVVAQFQISLFASLGLVSLTLSGCDNPPNNPKICSDPPSLSRDMERFDKPNVSSADSAFGFATGCVHRWSYALARSKEPAEVVSRAVVDGACGLAVSRSGEREFFLKQSLFHVVQARAGRCKIP